MCEIIQLTEEKPVVSICNYCIGLEQYLPGESICTNLDEAINEQNPKIEITTSHTFCFISQGNINYKIVFNPNINAFIKITLTGDNTVTFANIIMGTFKTLTIESNTGNSYIITRVNDV